MVKKAVELGLEIVFRIPHLSFFLQGKDTVSFKVGVALLCCIVILDVVVAAARVARRCFSFC